MPRTETVKTTGTVFKESAFSVPCITLDESLPAQYWGEFLGASSRSPMVAPWDSKLIVGLPRDTYEVGQKVKVELTLNHDSSKPNSLTITPVN